MAQRLHEVINIIIKPMFEAEERRIQAWTDRLCKQNQEHHPGCQIFFWNERFFRMSGIRGNIPPEKRKPLHSSLTDEADALIKDAKMVENDKAFIKQALFTLLSPCKDTQDIRDALPECLVDMVKWETTLPRTRPPAFTIQGNPRALRDYERMLPAMQVYSTARLIY